MTRFVIRRLLLGVLVLFVVSVAVFAIFFAGGDPAPRFCGKTCTPDRLALVRKRLYLDHSLISQYWHYLHGLVIDHNLGYSFASSRSVNSIIESGLPATASLALGAAVVWLVTGIPIGITAATKPRSIRDRLATVFALTGLSMPTFLVGLLLLYVLFYQLTIHGLHWFPPAGFVPITEDPVQWLVHLVLPCFTLAFVTAASYSRLTRGTMLEVLEEDYIRTARAKGLSERRVIYRHGLRSALTPIVTLLGIDIGTLLGGTIVTEKLFGLQGIGQSALTAQSRGDLPVVLGTVLVAAFFIVVANIIVDILYAVLDARVRLT
jgi:peptide/nickel transport system permease protein